MYAIVVGAVASVVVIHAFHAGAIINTRARITWVFAVVFTQTIPFAHLIALAWVWSTRVYKLWWENVSSVHARKAYIRNCLFKSNFTLNTQLIRTKISVKINLMNSVIKRGLPISQNVPLYPVDVQLHVCPPVPSLTQTPLFWHGLDPLFKHGSKKYIVAFVRRC